MHAPNILATRTDSRTGTMHYRFKSALLLLTAFRAGVGIFLLAPFCTLVSAEGASTLQLDDCNAPEFQTVLRNSPSTAQEANAYWLNRQLIKWPNAAMVGIYKLYYSSQGQLHAPHGSAVTGADGALQLDLVTHELPAATATRFKYVADGALLSLRASDLVRLPPLLTGQLLLVQENERGEVGNSTALQVAGALDDLYVRAEATSDLGVRILTHHTQFKLWAPTAQQVSVCLHRKGSGPVLTAHSLRRDDATGAWSVRVPRDLSGHYYTYMVDVFVAGVGMVRNRVTDPYSISLTTDSARSYIADLNAPSLKPYGWSKTPVPVKVRHPTEMVVYELHVRDFSANDASVNARHRGKYLAFTDTRSYGMRHLQALANAGLTDIHLLPVFDIATVPEDGCVAPVIHGQAPDSEGQQAQVMQFAAKDCFNWGYDPFHFSAPEGSFATDASDGATRIREFRAMVLALHRAGLRVGMDVVYNHTAASGQSEKSVLDRIVPGYYHRLDAAGKVERSTCCDNTATENMMMGKLMIDSTVLWATQYHVDSFRFDLMAHQPRSVMESLQIAVDAATGKHINLIGEGWNFGEVANGARFVQASQLSLNNSGIGTFSDRGRDAIRGGGAGDDGAALVANQGYINGFVYDPNDVAPKGTTASNLRQLADHVRVGLAGSIRDFSLITHEDIRKALREIDYGGQPAGYASEPSEVVNYVENHDNQTLFDINAYKLPLGTASEDRMRVQMLGVAINAFSQGIAYFHAGIDTLRSKSMDANSYDSGDWFNRIDWTYTDNYFGTGAPPKSDNGRNYAWIKPRLANPSIRPRPLEIAAARDMFRTLIQIRSSTTLFRLRSATDIKKRLQFYNTGANQNPVVLIGHVDGEGYPGAVFGELIYLINVAPTAQQIVLDEMRNKKLVLHPALQAAAIRDARISAADYENQTGQFTIPGRTALVYVRPLGRLKGRR